MPGAEEKASGSSRVNEARANTGEAGLIREHEFNYIFRIPTGEFGLIPREQLEVQHFCRQLGGFKEETHKFILRDASKIHNAGCCPYSPLLEDAIKVN